MTIVQEILFLITCRCVYLCIGVCTQVCLWKPEEHIEFPEARVVSGYGLPDMGARDQTQNQYMSFTDEPSLQPLLNAWLYEVRHTCIYSCLYFYVKI